MKRVALALLLWGLSPLPARSEPPAAVTVGVAPDPVYIERTPTGQYLSCDFFLTNHAAGPLDVSDVRARAFAEDGTLLAWKKLDSNGSRPSVETLGPRRVEAGATLTLFNPFDHFEITVPIARLSYEFRLSGPGDQVRAMAEVRPIEFKQPAPLILPVAGATLFAYDGPGLYSHHRRIDPNEPFNREVLKIRQNSQRYALDLVVLDTDGNPFRGNPQDQRSWAGFGFPVVAPGDGTVIQAVGDLPDEIPFDPAVLKDNPAIMAGNHVMIDHGNGTFSLLCHFRKDGLKVKPGQRVRQGAVIGEMGHSGMGSGLVHVHYELRNAADLFNAEGLPARFDHFRRAGEKVSEPGRVEAGAILTTDPVREPGPP